MPRALADCPASLHESAKPAARLRARREGPRHSGTTDKCDEITPPHGLPPMTQKIPYHIGPRTALGITAKWAARVRGWAFSTDPAIFVRRIMFAFSENGHEV